MSFGAILVSFEQQTFNDAIFFFEKIGSLSEKQPFERWRYITWTIVAADTCMEAYLNAFIQNKLNEQAGKIFQDNTYSFDKKISYFLEEILGLSISKGDEAWKNIMNLVKLRNKIVHHKTSHAIFNELTPENASKAVSSCKELIKRLHQAEGTSYPTWIDKIKSENYDTPS